MLKRMILIVFAGAISWQMLAASEGTSAEIKLDSKYPRLSSGPLRHAVLATLPSGVVAQVEEITVTTNDISKEIAEKPKEQQPQLTKYPCYVLDRILTERLIVKDAKTWASISGIFSGSDNELVQRYLNSIAAEIKVQDDEVVAYYNENRSMFGNLSFDQVKSNLRSYLENEKKTRAVQEFINTLGERHYIRISQRWAAQQYAKWITNPVEQVRRAGKPALIDFGSEKCVPCEMMKPILEKLTEEFKGKVVVKFVHVGKEPVLASQYGVQAIPCLLFCDKDGNEVFRHVGFLSREAIVKKFTELGFDK